tara:strand:+ start:407 stop:709 length:303 start_codon:yes stop_codon:yes gene_type:complete
MKKLLLAIAFISFIATSTFAVSTALSTSVDTVQCHDDKDCDKKDCKHDKKTCKKGDKKACKKGDKRACCSKDKAKKACCSKDKAKSCKKGKAKKEVKKGE